MKGDLYIYATYIYRGVQCRGGIYYEGGFVNLCNCKSKGLINLLIKLMCTDK